MVLLFGCRPSEAAYMIYSNSFSPNKFPELEGCDWAATVPPQFNKTKLLYKWPVEPKMIWMVKLVSAMHMIPDLESELNNSILNFTESITQWYRRRVIVDAAKESVVVSQLLRTQGFLCLRTVRAYHAKEWAQAAAKAKRLGLPMPFNPLQHVSSKTTMQHYVPPESEVVTPASTPRTRRRTKQRSKQEKALERATTMIKTTTNSEPAEAAATRKSARRVSSC